MKGNVSEKGKLDPRIIRNILFVLFIFVCFPVGLFLLWKKKKDFPFWAKVTLTSVVAMFLIMAVGIAMPKNNYDHTDVEYINISPDGNVYMSDIPDVKDAVVRYDNAYSADSVLVKPVETPEPIYVWCNDMGKYYHRETCRYVKETTPKVTLQQALVGGFGACPDCKPPVS